MNTKQKILLILNPVAGMGKAKDKLPVIHELLNKKDLDYETVDRIPRACHWVGQGSGFF